MTFRAIKLWKVRGTVTPVDRTVRPSQRTVVFEAADFAEASSLAAEALLTHWSSKPCTAEPKTLVPVTDPAGLPEFFYVQEPS